MGERRATSEKKAEESETDVGSQVSGSGVSGLGESRGPLASGLVEWRGTGDMPRSLQT